MISTMSPEERLRAYQASGDRAVRNGVVEDHMWLATTIVREFLRSSEPRCDLVQVAAIGLIKAADRFDPDYGAAFVSFASVTIRGELRRHYRDHGWTLRVPRSLQERRAEVRGAIDLLTSRHGRAPTTADLARHLHLGVDEINDALCADENYRPLSLESPTRTGTTVEQQTGDEEPGFATVDADQAFDSLARSCSSRLETVLRMRYVWGLTQSEIGRELGISQVHVSRLLARAHQVIRSHVRGQSGEAAVATAG